MVGGDEIPQRHIQTALPILTIDTALLRILVEGGLMQICLSPLSKLHCRLERAL
jgi:hypothetical protein